MITLPMSMMLVMGRVIIFRAMSGFGYQAGSGI